MRLVVTRSDHVRVSDWLSTVLRRERKRHIQKDHRLATLSTFPGRGAPEYGGARSHATVCVTFPIGRIALATKEMMAHVAGVEQLDDVERPARERGRNTETPTVRRCRMVSVANDARTATADTQVDHGHVVLSDRGIRGCTGGASRCGETGCGQGSRVPRVSRCGQKMCTVTDCGQVHIQAVHWGSIGIMTRMWRV